MLEFQQENDGNPTGNEMAMRWPVGIPTGNIEHWGSHEVMVTFSCMEFQQENVTLTSRPPHGQPIESWNTLKGGGSQKERRTFLTPFFKSIP